MNRMTSLMRHLTLGIAAAVLLAACQQNSEDFAKLREQQAQILAKLDSLEKKIDAAPPAAAAPPPRPSGPDPSKVYDIPVGASAIRGPKDAAITITEFSDYQCPFCARAEPIIEEALKAYPTQARFIYKHFPLTSIHPNAMGAAQAAVAAQKQGKAWEMHDLLFKNQRALQPEKLKEYAQQIGLDVAQFEKDMNSDEVKKQVEADMTEARKLGVRGTPTIFVNGKLLRNRSVEGIKEIAEPILAKANG